MQRSIFLNLWAIFVISYFSTAFGSGLQTNDEKFTNYEQDYRPRQIFPRIHENTLHSRPVRQQPSVNFAGIPPSFTPKEHENYANFLTKNFRGNNNFYTQANFQHSHDVQPVVQPPMAEVLINSSPVNTIRRHQESYVDPPLPPKQSGMDLSELDKSKNSPFKKRNALFHMGSEIRQDDSDLLDSPKPTSTIQSQPSRSPPHYPNHPRPRYPRYQTGGFGRWPPEPNPGGFGKWPPEPHPLAPQQWGYQQTYQPRFPNVNFPNVPPYQQGIMNNNINSVGDSGQSFGPTYGPQNFVAQTGSYQGVQTPPNDDIRTYAGQSNTYPGGSPQISQNSLNSLRSIGWFDTRIDRYETGKNTVVNRVVLPSDFYQVNGIPQQPVPTPMSGYDQRTGLGAGSQVLTDANRPAGFQTLQNQPPPSTRILTGDPQQNIQETGPSSAYIGPENKPNLRSSTPPSTTPYPSYPDMRDKLFPIVENHQQEIPKLTKDFDPRPQTPVVDRPQYTFAGGNNQYREDLGRASEFRREINNIRLPYEMIYNPKTRENEPLNKFHSRVNIENFPQPPYSGTSRTNPRQGVGDDLSQTDSRGTMMGRTDVMFTTRVPWNQEFTTVIGVPQFNVDEKFLQSRNLPYGSSVDGLTIVQPNSNQGYIRPYYGPEEITRSRYQQQERYNIKEPGNRNRFVKMDLSNVNGEAQ